MSKRVVFALALIAAVLLLAGCAKSATIPTPSPTRTTASSPSPTASPSTPTLSPSPTQPGTDAAQLFATTCAVCHGAKRQGVSGLGLPLLPEALAGKTDAELKDTITNGRPGTLMIAWKDTLTPAAIDALVKFIRSPVQ